MKPLLITTLIASLTEARSRKRPNIVLLVADDLDVDSAYVLWETQKKIKELGVDMTNTYATTPLCCPSRSSILTGLYAHNHGVNTNTGPICGGDEWRENFEDKQIKEPMNDETIRYGNMLHRKRLQTLLSLDDAVSKIVKQVEDLGLIDNTYFIFTSDHGYHIGQFGMVKGKSTPYEFDTKIPFYVRGPGIKAPPKEKANSPTPPRKEITLNIDIAPTLLGLAGLSPPKIMDGLNMAGVIRGYARETRDSFIIEKKGNIGLSQSEKIKIRVHDECTRNPIKYAKADANGEGKAKKCMKTQTDICIWNDHDQTYQMSPCTSGGYIDPTKGQCNCDELFVKEIARISSHIKGKAKRKNKNRRNTIRDARRTRSRKRKSLHRAKRQVVAARRSQQRQQSRLRAQNPVLVKKRAQVEKLTQPDKTGYGCQQTREGKMACDNMSREQWRSNYNLALEKQEALRKELSYIENVLKKLKTKKPAESKYSKPDHIPCTCISGDSFKKKVDAEIRAKSMKDKVAREEQKERKLRRMTKFQQSCKSPGMSCFTVDNSTWEVEPRWTGAPQCHCTSASNSTYSCLRRIGHGAETAELNYLYCEFKEGDSAVLGGEYHHDDYFKEYYDLDRDPYQLENTFDSLSQQIKTQLNEELRQRTQCSGAACSCKEQKLDGRGQLVCLEDTPGLKKPGNSSQRSRPRSPRNTMVDITSWRQYFL